MRVFYAYSYKLLQLGICLMLYIMPARSQTTVTESSDTPQTNTVADKISSFSDKGVRFIQKKYAGLSNTVEKQTLKLLKRMQRKEAKLQKRLHGIDSTEAQQLLAGTEERYKQLQTKLQSPVGSTTTRLQEYIPGLDSVKTSLSFLSKNSGAFPGISTDKLAQIQVASGQVQQLEGRMQQANEVQQYIKDREAYLKQQLQNTSLAKAVRGINEEVYYYQQRLNGYKELLNDPEKLGEKLLTTVSALPAFRKFFQQNSYLSQLFQMPGGTTSQTPQPGLQTSAGVQSIIGQRLGSAAPAGGVDPQQYVQSQMQGAPDQLTALKDKLAKLGGSGNSDMTMPDFKPNSQHTKSFLQRLQWGFNIQSQQGTKLLPATSSMALTVGYKLSDKKTVGIGASYNLGMGHGLDNIRLSNEGVGLRSFADMKLKGSIWLTGGFEYTYYKAFAKLSDIRNLDVWQKSALAGLSKKYNIGKKREGNIQLLYDFLADRQIPRGQTFKFRLGYSF